MLDHLGPVAGAGLNLLLMTEDVSTKTLQQALTNNAVVVYRGVMSHVRQKLTTTANMHLISL